jgi:hypothetical protein
MNPMTVSLRIILATVIAAGCTSSLPIAPSDTSRNVAPLSSTMAPVMYRPILLNEMYEFDVDPIISSGLSCEIGNDPVPCAWFAVNVARAATLSIRVEAATEHAAFIDSPVDQFFASDRSPVIVRTAVDAGELKFKVGLNDPWGFRGDPVHFRLRVTSE